MAWIWRIQEFLSDFRRVGQILAINIFRQMSFLNALVCFGPMNRRWIAQNNSLRTSQCATYLGARWGWVNDMVVVYKLHSSGHVLIVMESCTLVSVASCCIIKLQYHWVVSTSWMQCVNVWINFAWVALFTDLFPINGEELKVHDAQLKLDAIVN